MKITIVSALDSVQKKEIQYLVECCKKEEPITLSFPMDQAELYVLASHQGHIVSAAAFLKIDEETYECSAFTHPDFRRKGYFSALLEEGLSTIPEEADLLFYSCGEASDAVHVLNAMDAQLLSKEHMMEISLSRERFSSCAYEAPTVLKCMEDQTEILLFSNPFGSLKISVSDTRYYLYAFEIQKPHRKKGHGRALLLSVLSYLSETQELPLFLQVSEDNAPALKLYEKTGFHITETLSCWLY